MLLHHSLPPLIWPCAVVMLGGAAMVIVPTFGKVGSAAGSIRASIAGVPSSVAGMEQAGVLAAGRVIEPPSPLPLPISASCRVPARG